MTALVWFVCHVCPAFAQVELQLDRSELPQGQSTQFVVTVRGLQPSRPPQVEATRGLRVTWIGQTRQNHILGGERTFTYQFRYEVVGLELGPQRLGPAVAMIGTPGKPSQAVQSNHVEVQVEPSEVKADMSATGVEVSTAFLKPELWQGETILYRHTLRAREELIGPRWHGLPREGLAAPRDGHRDRKEFTEADTLGLVHIDDSWRAYNTPAAGEFAFDPPVVELNLSASAAGRQGTQSTTVVLQGQPSRLLIKSRPSPPPNFSGLVGNFEMTSRMERDEPVVGGSIRWMIELNGDSTLEGFQFPALPAVDGVRVYEGEHRTGASLVQGRYLAFGRFERTIVPTKQGEVTIPSTELIVFSTSEGRYVTLRLPSQKLTVGAGENADFQVESFADARPSAAPEESLGMRELWTRGTDTRWALERTALPAALSCLIVPSLMLTLGRTRERWQTWQAKRAATRPDVRAATPLAHLPDEPQARLQVLDNILRQLSSGVSPSSPHGLALKSLRQVMDRTRFAGTPPPADLEDRIRELYDELEGR